MGSRHYLLIVLEGEHVPEKLDFDSSIGNAQHVHTSDLKQAIQAFPAARMEVRHEGCSVRVRAVRLDDADTFEDFNLSREPSPLVVTEV